jgi:hypothetical protein
MTHPKGASAALTNDERLRAILALRMLVVAWAHEPRASWGMLAAAAVANGEQYAPPLERRELTALRHLTIEQLFDPDAVKRRRGNARAGPRTRPGRAGRPPTDK